MFSLAINIPMINDATSFYRGSYPIAQLHKRCRNLIGLSPQAWSEATIRTSDGCFFQRPFMADHKTAIMMAKETGRKVWVDYDDYLLDVPTDNPTYRKYMTKEVNETLIWILQNSDIVTVSTAPLAHLYSQYAKNIKIVPNAMDMDLRCVKDRWNPGKRNKVMAWRGSATHHRDVFRFSRALLTVSRDHPDKAWGWHFVGDNLWFLTDSMPHLQTFLTQAMGPIEFLRHIQALSASCFHVPLDDSPFNRCKSNIAWMEAAFSGAAAIVPDWEVWDVPGALKYKNEEEFANLLYAVMNGEIDVEAKAKESWDYIEGNLTLPKVNEARVDVLCELFECDRSDLGVV